MSNVGIEQVRAGVRALDEKFSTMQKKIDAMMTKLGVTVKRMANSPSRGEHFSNVDKIMSNSCINVFFLARSMSKELVNKLLDCGNACEKPSVLST